MIGLFDSGIGGLTVFKAVARNLPGTALMYLGDTARTPYGNKSADVISAYGVEAARFLVEQGAKVLVVACNTVSAVGLEHIRREFPNIPLFDVVTPAVANVISHGFVRVGIMGTRALVASGVYQASLPGVHVVAHAAPLLVPLVEENWLKNPETKRIVKRYLQPFKQAQVEALVLACTHYPLLKELIRPRLSRRTKIIDPAEETARVLVAWLAEHPEVASKLTRGEHRFYVTDTTPQAVTITERWLKQSVKLEQVNL